MSYAYYENWRRTSLHGLKEAQESKASLESLLEKSHIEEPEISSKIEEVARILSDAEGLHKKYKYPHSMERSRQALTLLKDLHYLALASKE
jgi:hypothetical protein